MILTLGALSKKRKVEASDFKSQGQCFSMQVVMNMCLLLNPEKNVALIYLAVF